MENEKLISAETPYKKIVELEETTGIVRIKQNQGLRVVLTTGVYDIFHYKHAESLACISSFGDFLVVGIPDDRVVINAAVSETQVKDRLGPIVDYGKRAKVVSHLPYVDLIFRKTKDKFDLITQIKPDILVQSITSGRGVVEEALGLQNHFPTTKFGSVLILDLGDVNCKLIFVDDVVDATMKIVPFSMAVDASIIWEKDKLSADKFNGTLIKKTIVERSINKHK